VRGKRGKREGRGEGEKGREKSGLIAFEEKPRLGAVVREKGKKRKRGGREGKGRKTAKRKRREERIGTTALRESINSPELIPWPKKGKKEKEGERRQEEERRKINGFSDHCLNHVATAPPGKGKGGRGKEKRRESDFEEKGEGTGNGGRFHFSSVLPN